MMMVEEVMPMKRKKPPRIEALATSFNSFMIANQILFCARSEWLLSLDIKSSIGERFVGGFEAYR